VRTGNVIGLAACILGLAACQPNASPTPPPPPPQNDALAARVAALESGLQVVSQEAARAQVGVYRLENRYADAVFDPSEPAFQRIDAGSVASFAVSVEDVTQFGDGVKLKLNLGNLSSATVQGVTLHISYGSRRPTEAGAAYTAWENSLKRKDADITEALLPGNWNPVPVVLPGIDQRNFGYVDISMDAKTISLHKR
jgi:hypothetical protein